MKRIVSLLLVIVILTLTLAACGNDDSHSEPADNTPAKTQKEVASSENFEISQGVMAYFANSIYRNWVNANYYYILFGFFQFDPSVSFDTQMTTDGQTTYYDFFVSETKKMVTRYLNYCEAALEDPYFDYKKAESDAQAYADEAIENIKTEAKANGKTTSAYIRELYNTCPLTGQAMSASFGKYITQNDIKKALVIEYIAGEYANFVKDRYNEAVDTALENQYFKNNLSIFVSAEVIYVRIPSSEASKVDQLCQAMNVEEFNALLSELGYQGQVRQLSYTLDTDLGNYLFGGVEQQYGISAGNGGNYAALNDIFVEEEHDYYNVYFVSKPAHRDETRLRNVGHILFKIDTAGEYKTSAEAKAAAMNLLAKIKEQAVNGVVPKEIFESMGQDVTCDSSVFYEDVTKGVMVAEFENWLFSANTEGELGLVETQYGWHIMYYVGESGKVAWRKDAHEGAVDEEIQNWYTSLSYTIEFDDSVFDKIFN